MNKYLDFRDYIFGSYGVPFFTSDSINTIITGYTILGPFKVDAVGVQARLIGLVFLVFFLVIMYCVLIEIPKSLGKEKMKEVLNIFFRSPFFITWLICVYLRVFGSFLEYPALAYFGMLIVCFLFQILFNRKIIQIYLK